MVCAGLYAFKKKITEPEVRNDFNFIFKADLLSQNRKVVFHRRRNEKILKKKKMKSISTIILLNILLIPLKTKCIHLCK